jgi:hypothetical protein
MNVHRPAQLLWTGGWDSTFRLLDLVLNQNRAVQPYYVVDRRRRSTPIELATMERIKRVLADMDTKAITLIGDTRITEKDDILPDPIITASYERIKSEGHFGSQYDWLPRYVRQNNIEGAELSWQKGDRGYARLLNSLEWNGDAMVLAEKPASPDHEIFRPFRFPLVHRTKRDMMEIAMRTGFIHLMNITHFCFNPDRKGRACGVCTPCSLAIEEGMGQRIPWHGHARRIVRRGRSIGSKVKQRVMRASQLG